MNTIDQNIDLNLELLFKAREQELFLNKLKNVEGTNMSRHQALKIAKHMEREGLVIIEGERCDITRHGLDIMEEYGCWVEYQIQTEEENEKLRELTKRKNELEVENLEHIKRNRVLDDEIKQLTRQNLKFQRQRFWVGLVASFVGTLFGWIVL